MMTVGARGKVDLFTGVLVLLVLLLIGKSSVGGAGFIKEPSPSIYIVPSGDNVTYYCQHNETAAQIAWRINGRSLGSSGMQGFKPKQAPAPSGSGANLHSLHINTSAIDTTLQVFTIQCTAMRVGTDNVTLVLIYPESNTKPGELVTTNIIKENNSSLVQVEVYILVKLLHNIPRGSTGIFSLSLNPADEQLQEQERREFGFMRPTFEHHHSGLVMVLKLNHSLPSHRVWNCTLLEHNDTSEANVTTKFINKHFELSTHDIQNISISLINSTTPNAIEISADIINGFQSKGFLAIAQSAVDIRFVVALRQNDENTITTNITDINGREYNIAVYTIEKNGLPFSRPASKPQKLNSSDKGDDNASLSPLPISECVDDARKKFSESDSKKLVVVVANLSDSQNIYVNFSDNITDKDLHEQYAAIFRFVDGFISGYPITCTSSIDQGPRLITIIIVTAILLVAGLVGFIIIMIIMIIIVQSRRRRSSNTINALPALNRVESDGPSQPTSDELVESDGPSQPPQQNNSLRFRATGKDRHKS